MTSKLRHPALKLVALLLVVVMAASGCMSTNQKRVFDQVNNSRSSRGIRAMGDNAWMADYAQDWANHMASTGRLAHSNFSAHNPYNWRGLAENVGRGTSLSAIHNSFMNSTAHRGNILNGSYDYLGTGVAYGHGQWWVVHEFMNY